MALDPFKFTEVKEVDLKISNGTKQNLETKRQAALAKYKASGKKNAEALETARYLERRLNDFKGDRYYGRGTIDDKAAIVSSLYALRTLSDLQSEDILPKLRKPIQVIIETSEETAGDGVAVYLAWAEKRYTTADSSQPFNPKNELNIGLDSLYPASTAEDGIYREQLIFAPVQNTLSGNQVEIEYFHGASKPGLQAGNTIPGLFTVVFHGPGVENLEKLLNQKKFRNDLEKFLQKKWAREDNEKSVILASKAATIESLWHPLFIDDPKNPILERNGDSLTFRLSGYERVSFMAMDSDSALIRAAGFMAYLHDHAEGFTLIENHFSNLLTFAWNQVGFDYYGKKLKIDFYDKFASDESLIRDPSELSTKSFMGPLIIAPTKIGLSKDNNHGEVSLFIDMRAPRTNVNKANDADELARTYENFKTKAHAALAAHKNEYAFRFYQEDGKDTPAYMANPRYKSPNDPYMKSLQHIFQKYTDRSDFGFISCAGSTTASMALGGINFGPTLPFENDVYHIPNEFKKVDNFYLDLSMFTHAFLELGSLSSNR
jgi:acetylornithine deacetylase/succinyl-diaminopimelate desuccinylase-like protein